MLNTPESRSAYNRTIEALRGLSLTPQQRLQESIETIAAINDAENEDANMDDQEIVAAIETAVEGLNDLIRRAFATDIEVELGLGLAYRPGEKAELHRVQIKRIRRVLYIMD